MIDEPIAPAAQGDIITMSGEHGPKYWEKVLVPGRQGDPVSGAPTYVCHRSLLWNTGRTCGVSHKGHAEPPAGGPFPRLLGTGWEAPRSPPTAAGSESMKTLYTVKASRHCRVYSDKIRFMPWESPRCTSGTTLTAENKDVGLCPVCFKTGLRVD